MKITYDLEADTLRIGLQEGAVSESDEEKPGVILDYDAEGNVLSLEILDASLRVTNPKGVEYAVVGGAP